MLILQQLREAGYIVDLQSEEIKLTWNGAGKPDPGQVKPLLVELKEHKQEAIAYLRAQHSNVIDFHKEVTRVKAQLRRTGIVRIRSKTLREDVYFAAEEMAADKIKQSNVGAVVYFLSELKELARGGNMTHDDLRRIHEAKRVFNGKIVESNKSPFA